MLNQEDENEVYISVESSERDSKSVANATDELELNESDFELDPQARKILEGRRERFEEKIEYKAEAYERLADKHDKLSGVHYKASKQISDQIPFGQPVMRGHHSEGRHLRDLDRIHSNMGKSIEHQKTANYYAEKLANLKSSNVISSDDPDAIPKLKKKLADMEECQQFMKSANAIIRKKSLSHEQKVEQLQGLGMGEATAKELLTPTHGGVGYAGYELTNNNANIRNVRLRIEELEIKLAAAAEAPIEEKQYPELRLKIVFNRELDRLQVVFDEKKKQPDEVKAVLRTNGLIWAGSQTAWQRRLNSQSKWQAERIVTQLRQLQQMQY